MVTLKADEASRLEKLLNIVYIYPYRKPTKVDE
jgi:hypothetical protein